MQLLSWGRQRFHWGQREIAVSKRGIKEIVEDL